MKRRDFLKRLGLAPVVGAVGAHHAVAAATKEAMPVMYGGGEVPPNVSGAAGGGASPVRITRFADWLTPARKKEIRDAAKRSAQQCLDADLICWNVPLTTKVRHQTRRNEARVLAHRRSWFEQMVRDSGYFNDYGG
jgi:hypothetical protein